MQQIPRDKRYRACFVPEDGKIYVVADLSQIELRAVAEIANEEKMLSIFDKNGDIHTATAQSLSKKEKVSKKERQAAKPVNFGLVYGMGAEKLASYAKTEYGVDMSVEEAERNREVYFKTYPGLEAWQRKEIEVGQNKRMTRTLSGRIRFLGEDKYSEFLNFPIQGVCADGLKVTLRLLYERLRGKPASMVHMVHDEIIVETEKEEVEEVKAILEKSMIEGIEALLVRVPIVVEAGTGISWADKK